MNVAGVESHPVPAEKIKLGVDGRDEEIENYIAAIKALSNVGIPVLCYNFMAGLGWYRTKVDAPGRGGALITDFDNAAAKASGSYSVGRDPEEKMWDNITYFLKAVIPVAEKASIQMALHPDDPPLSPLRGIGTHRHQRGELSEHHEYRPQPRQRRHLLPGKLHRHGRRLSVPRKANGESRRRSSSCTSATSPATREHFRETFHDEGQTDMVKMLKTYHEIGFNGPMRPDHAPTLDEEANDNPGYAIQGKIFAIGYMKGVMQGLGLPYA